MRLGLLGGCGEDGTYIDGFLSDLEDFVSKVSTGGDEVSDA